MGSDACEFQEAPFPPSSAKVHRAMCTLLRNLVDRVSGILPDIEAARPRCSAGIQALSQLQLVMDRARELVRNCCESSKLYLALTGEVVESRFERTRSHLEQNLSQLQNMVPVVLQLQISEIVCDLRVSKFFLDSHEKEAGKALRALLQQDESLVDSVGNSEVDLLQFAASTLQLTSQKDLLIERRSIKKLLNGVTDKKAQTLKYLLRLLKKHDKLLVNAQPGNPAAEHDGACVLKKSLTTEPNSNRESCLDFALDTTRTGALDGQSPPEEFKCPLSSKLMSDPVVISSGQTYERASIQKWFDDGHDTCPKTRLKLDDLSVRPNTAMRDLISKWVMKNGVIAPHPTVQALVLGSLENSSNSICSDASSMKDIHLRIDMSNISLGSLDSSYSSDFSHAIVKDSFASIPEAVDLEQHRFRFYDSIHDIKRRFLSNVGELPWESQRRAVQDVQDYLIHYNPSCAFVSSGNFLEPLVQFLKDALDKNDVEAQEEGTQLLSTYLRATRREISHVSKDIFALVTSFVENGTEAAAEMLSVMEILSADTGALSKFAASGALTSVVEVLDLRNKKLQVAAIRILYNLSPGIGTRSWNLCSDWIPRLVPFLRDASVAGTCMGILENFCKFEEGRVCIAQTNGCIASLVELLEGSSCKDQELAIGILLSLCAQRDQYCHLVLHEGIIPVLCHVSVNGSDKGKVGASELLRLLRDIKYDEDENRPANYDEPEDLPEKHEEKKPSKRSRSLGLKVKMLLRGK